MAAAVDRFREVLRRYVGRNELVEIYDDAEDLDKFEVGFICAVGEDEFFVKKIDRKGRYNGHYMGRLDDIVRLATSTQYLTSLRLLHEHARTKGDEVGDFPAFETLAELIRFANLNKVLVEVGTDIFLYGFITEYSKEHIEVLELNKSGIEDGVHYLDLEAIDRIDLGGPDIQARKFLHQVRLGL